TLMRPSSARPRSGHAARSNVSARSSGCCNAASSHARRRSCSAGTITALGRVGERWFARLRDLQIALPSLVLQLQVLDRDGVGVRVEVRQRLNLGDPGAIHLVGDRELTGFVVDLDDDVLAEVVERDLRAEPGSVVPDLVGSLLELRIMSHATLERDRVVLVATRGLSR